MVSEGSTSRVMVLPVDYLLESFRIKSHPSASQPTETNEQTSPEESIMKGCHVGVVTWWMIEFTMSHVMMPEGGFVGIGKDLE